MSLYPNIFCMKKKSDLNRKMQVGMVATVDKNIFVEFLTLFLTYMNMYNLPPSSDTPLSLSFVTFYRKGQMEFVQVLFFDIKPQVWKTCF